MQRSGETEAVDEAEGERHLPAAVDIAREEILHRHEHDRGGDRRLDDGARDDDDLQCGEDSVIECASVNAVTILITGNSRRAHKTIAIRKAI